MSTPDEEVVAQIESYNQRRAGVLKPLEVTEACLDKVWSIMCYFWSPNLEDAAVFSRVLYERGNILL